MIMLYDSFETLGGFPVIGKPSLYFEKLPYPQELDDVADNLLRVIDRVSSRTGDVIVTPYGTATIRDLSGGTKTALVVKHCVRHAKYDFAIPLHSCGANVLPFVFEFAGGSPLKLVLQHYTFDRSMPDFMFNLNDGEFICETSASLVEYWFSKTGALIDAEQ